MGTLKKLASNELIAIEVLVVSENMASWLWLTPLIGARRVGLFVSEPVSWSTAGGCREVSFEVIGFSTPARNLH